MRSEPLILQPGNPREELVNFNEDSTIAGGTLCSLFNQEIAKLADAVVLLEEELIKEEDWNLKWKEHFRPVPLGKSLMVIAPWMEHQPDSERLPLIIDPGQGFGTGHHPSTALAVEMLEIYLDKLDHKPNRLLDVGSGSGILAIGPGRYKEVKATISSIQFGLNFLMYSLMPSDSN